MDISLTAVLAQVINFGLLFFLFRRFLTKPIVSSIEERRSLIKKLENAEDAYAEKVAAGDAEYKKKLQQGMTKRDKLIAEAGAVANKRKEEIMKDAKHKAEGIMHDAELRSKNFEDELKNNFEEGVKKTSLLVIKKLLQEDKDLKSKYLDRVVKDLV